MKERIEKQEDLVISLSANKDPELREKIDEQIEAFNDLVSEPHRQARKDGTCPLHITLRDQKGILKGGLIADTYWDWLAVIDFWLDESVREQGFGRSMLQTAEKEAAARGCRFAKLETFSFQARGFYEKCGYRVVGQLDDYPQGQSFFWMRKDLE